MNKKTRIHPKVILTVACIILSLFFACIRRSIENTSHVPSHRPVMKETLITDPFGYKPTIKNFSNFLRPDYKLQIYSIKNIHKPQVSDTIYRFYKKKSELFIYKTIDGRELFFAANIFDDKVILNNGIKTGMSREEFFKGFTNLKKSTEDTIILGTKRSTTLFNFIFKNERLHAIKINNYID